jgi:hypothetical protein
MKGMNLFKDLVSTATKVLKTGTLTPTTPGSNSSHPPVDPNSPLSLGITDELVLFVREISKNPATFTKFPLETELDDILLNFFLGFLNFCHF